MTLLEAAKNVYDNCGTGSGWFLVSSEDMGELRIAIEDAEGSRFMSVSCSQCGSEFGPGNHGFSECASHEGMVAK